MNVIFAPWRLFISLLFFFMRLVFFCPWRVVLVALLFGFFCLKGLGQDIRCERLLPVSSAAANERDYYPNLYSVDYYKPEVYYVAGGGNNPLPFTNGGKLYRGNEIVRVRISRDGETKQYPLSMGPEGLVQTNAFGSSAKTNIIVSLDMYDKRLLDRNYPNNTKTNVPVAQRDKCEETDEYFQIPNGSELIDTAYGFLISRKIDNNQGWSDDSYIYAFKIANPTANDPKLDGFILRAGKTKVQVKQYELDNRSNGNNVQDKEYDADNTGNYSGDKMRAVLAIDKDKAWAVGKGVLKLFNGKEWTKFSNKQTSQANNNNNQTNTNAQNGLPAEPQKSQEANKQVCGFPDVQLSAIAGRMENRADPDTVWAVGERGTIIRVIYQLNSVNGTQTTTANTNNCSLCATGANCSVDNVQNISITYKTNNNNGNNCNTQGQNTANDQCKLGEGLPGKDITTIAYAGGDTLYVGVAESGVYVSYDGGKKFQQSEITTANYRGVSIDAKSASLNGMSFVGSRTGYVVGSAMQSNQVASVFRYNCNGCNTQNNAQNSCKGYFYDQVDISFLGAGNCNFGNRPDFNATSFLSNDLGVIVGNNGVVIRIVPRFRVACDKDGLPLIRPSTETYNTPPVSLYNVGDVLRQPNTPSPVYTQLTLCSADVLRCATGQNNKDLSMDKTTMGCDCNQWSPFAANTRVVDGGESSVLGSTNCDCVLDIFGETNGSQPKCPEPQGANKRKYTDVYVDATAITDSKWKLLSRPAELEVLLLDTNQNPAKSPVYGERELVPKESPSRWKRTKLSVTASVGTELSLRLNKFENLPKGTSNTTTVTNGNNQSFIYDYAKHLKPYYCYVSGGPYPLCSTVGNNGLVNNDNNFKFRVRSLIPNFSLSPSIANLVFGVGPGFADRRRVRVVRPALVPYMYAPEASKESYCESSNNRQKADFQNGYAGALDSFVMPTNTAYKLSAKATDEHSGFVFQPKNRDDVYEIMIDKIKGKVEDTPLLRRANHYDTLKPDHDQTWVNLKLKQNYINSFVPSTDYIQATITGPHYDPNMRPSMPGENGLPIPSPATTLLPAMTARGKNLEQGQDLDANGKFIGDPVRFVELRENTQGLANCCANCAGGTNGMVPVLVDDPTEEHRNLRLHLANGSNSVAGDGVVCSETTKDDILEYISTHLRQDQLPTVRFPRIKHTQVCINRSPLVYTFSFKGKSVDGKGVKDGDWVEKKEEKDGQVVKVEWVWKPDSLFYDKRMGGLEQMHFSAEGKPIGDSTFKIKVDARYGYRIGALYDLRRTNNEKRFHYYLLKQNGKNANDSMPLRGHPPVAQQPPPPQPQPQPAPFFTDSIRIWDYDTVRENSTAQAGQATQQQDKVLLGMQELSILLRQNFTNYEGKPRIDTATYFVNGYGEGRGSVGIHLRRIRFLRVLQDAALLRLGKDPKAVPNETKAIITLSYARDSVKKGGTEIVRGQRDSVFVRSNVKWYVKTKRQLNSNGGQTDAYGKGFGIWWDTLGGVWTTLVKVKPDIPKNWPNNGHQDDLRVALATKDKFPEARNGQNQENPFFKIKFKALQSNITDEQRKDSIQVCTLGDSVCAVVYIVQDTPKLNVRLLTNSYRDLRTKKKPYAMFTGFKKDKSPFIRTRDSAEVKLAGLGEWRLIDSGCYRGEEFKKVSELPVMNGNGGARTYIPMWLEEQRKLQNFSDDTITLANTYPNLSDSQRRCIVKVCAISWEDALNKKDSLNSKRKYCQELQITQDTATINVKLPKKNNSGGGKNGAGGGGNGTASVTNANGLPFGGFEGDARGEDLRVPYFLGARSSICIGSDGDIEVEMPAFLKIVPCQTNPIISENYICNVDSNETKKNSQTQQTQTQTDPKMEPQNGCLFAKGDTPVYNQANNCPTEDKWNKEPLEASTIANKFKHQFKGEDALDHCRPYCLQVVNRNESLKERTDTLKITVLGTNRPVVRKLVVLQEGVKIGLYPQEISLGRRAGAQSKFAVSTDAKWELIDYDRSYYSFQPNAQADRIFDRSPFNVNLEALQNNELDERFKTEVLVTPTDVCQTKRRDLSAKLKLIQDSFFFRYTLIPTPFEPKYPEILPGPIYQVPAPQNKYLRFLVESNSVWTVGGGGLKNKYRKILKPVSGISPYEVDTLLIQVEDLQNFLKGRDDSVDLGVIRRDGSIRWMDKIHYRQKPYDFEENNLVLYPNPVTSRLYVRSTNGFKNGYVFIYGMNGELIAKRRYNEGLIDFDFGTLPMGVYFIRVYDGNLFVTKKIIRH